MPSGYTNFVKRTYYITFDLSDCLNNNVNANVGSNANNGSVSNVLGVMLGNGW